MQPVVQTLVDIYINRGNRLLNERPFLLTKSSPEENHFLAFESILQADRLCMVILGQDPYPQPHTATGIAFANPEGKQSISPSLQVLKEVAGELFPEETFDITLQKWVKQGILPLNSCLTVPYYTPGAHSRHWTRFTADFLKDLSSRVPDLCYILLGDQASMFKANIMSGKILEEFHPAYYARKKLKMPPRVWIEALSYVKKTFNKELIL